ncbi:MAG: hypothetical protein RMJ55_05825 [Roseiflexaceae bacterium]|nr:hypothetical protein [Roseiflexaceae bacterium]
MKRLRVLWGIALTEWKLQVRAIVFWVGLIVLLLYALARVIGLSEEIAFLHRQWFGGREESLIWLAIVLIFLAPSALARDRRTAVLVHSTPVTGSVYAAGKLLGVWLTALTLTGIEWIAQFLARIHAWDRLTPEVVSMILVSFGGWIIGSGYIVALYFLLTTLVKGRALFAYALGAAYFVAVLAIRDAANPFDFVGYPVFRSDLVGDGPELLLVTSHRWFYAGLAIVVALLSVLVYSWREHRSNVRRSEQAALMAGLALALGATAWAGSAFVSTRAQVLAKTGLLPQTHSALAADDVRAVRMSARIDPERDRIEGRVELTFARPLEEVMWHIPPGLKLSAVTDCQTQPAPVNRLNAEWVALPFTPQICVAFEGSLRADRAAYRQHAIRSGEAYMLNAGAYIGQGYVYLTPAARWYPAPTGSYEWMTVHDIHVMIPRALPSLAVPEATISVQDEWVSYEWRHHQGRPLITLAAGAYEQITLPDGAIVWVSPEHQHIAPQAAEFFLGFLKPVDELLERDKLTYHVVETPVLRWPMVSGYVVLLPERYFTERLSPALETMYEQDVKFSGPQFAFQKEAYHTIRGWLLGQVFCADTSFIGESAVRPNPSLDPFSGFVPLCESLMHYLSLQLLDERFAVTRLDEIMEARIRYADDYLNNPELRQRGGGIDGELPAPPYQRSWEFNQMFAAIGRLEKRVGREHVNDMIGLLLERRYGGAVTVADWLNIINEVAGSEARREFESTSMPQLLQRP